MSDTIDIAVIEDNRMFTDGLRAWAADVPEMHLSAVVSTVDELLAAGIEHLDVVLLNAALRGDPDPALNVRRLIDTGHRVLVIDGSPDLNTVARTLAFGAHGYLTRDHGFAALAVTLRAIAAGGTAWSVGPAMAAEPDGSPPRPHLSEREHAVLMAYASGMTLQSTARHLGISPGTARTYLDRVKAKYEQAGLPVHTKLELADRVRADCSAGGACPQSARTQH